MVLITLLTIIINCLTTCSIASDNNQLYPNNNTYIASQNIAKHRQASLVDTILTNDEKHTTKESTELTKQELRKKNPRAVQVAKSTERLNLFTRICTKVSDRLFIHSQLWHHPLKKSLVATSPELFELLNYLDNADDRNHALTLQGYKAIELQKIIEAKKQKRVGNYTSNCNQKLWSEITRAVAKVSNSRLPLTDKSITIQPCHHHLQNYTTIIDVNGDGNCAYRAFILSSCINNHTHMQNYFQNLLEHKFMQLFTTYDTNFRSLSSYDKKSVGEEILAYLLQTLHTIELAKNDHTIVEIYNKNKVFDYYMIMFFRYMLADYVHNKATNEDKDIISAVINAKRDDIKKAPLAEQDALKEACAKIVRWKEWIDELEITYLAKALETNIHPIQLEADFNARTNLKDFVGTAPILFINNNHYQVLVQRKYITHVINAMRQT